jgi:hypothetical protein
VKHVTELTRFLAKIASKNETTENGLYKVIQEHPLCQAVAALDPNADERAKAAITAFIAESFTTMIQDICSQYAIMLLEIKNQCDEFNDKGEAPDIVKLESMGSKSAETFKILVDVLKHAIEDVDWEYVAERIITAGQAARAGVTTEKSPFSDN